MRKPARQSVVSPLVPRAPLFTPIESRKKGISPSAVANGATFRKPDYSGVPRSESDWRQTFTPAKPAPGVVPAGITPMAMDTTIVADPSYMGIGMWGDNQQWLGLPYLSELAQRPEYRRITEVIARDMTRQWIELRSTSGEPKSDKIKVLEDALERHQIREKFARVAELDGFFGRGHLYIDTGYTEDREELKLPLIASRVKVKGRGGLREIRVVDPNWTYPGQYNSNDPLLPDFYKPTTWYVMGKEVHSSRLLTFVSRELPDLLKPAYSFGGLSMSQMAKPYVDNWLRTRQSVSDLVASFSIPVLKTDMSQILNEGDAVQLNLRAQLFNNYRANASLMMLNKETEDFAFIQTSLSTLDHLQAQSQEHMSSVSGIPLVVLLGISPSGLNATSEGELAAWQNNIHSMQEHLFKRHLKTILDIIQIDVFAEIDPDITFTFLPLEETNENEKSLIKKTEAEIDAIYITSSVVGPEEVRERLAKDEDSQYAELSLEQPLVEDFEEPLEPEVEPEKEVVDVNV